MQQVVSQVHFTNYFFKFFYYCLINVDVNIIITYFKLTLSNVKWGSLIIFYRFITMLLFILWITSAVQMIKISKLNHNYN